MAGLAGGRFAAVAAKLATFLEGGGDIVGDLLVPVLGGINGTPDPDTTNHIPLTHDDRLNEGTVQPGASGTLQEDTLAVFVQQVVPVQSLFDYDGDRWNVTECAHDRAAGADWPFRLTLERIVR